VIISICQLNNWISTLALGRVVPNEIACKSTFICGYLLG
jgi:hypothetical protein